MNPAGDPSGPASASDPSARLESLVRRAGWILVWERAWPPLAWAGTVVALFLAASWVGLWFELPRLARFVALGIFARGVAGRARAARAGSLAQTQGGSGASRSRGAAGPPARVGTGRQARQRSRRRPDPGALGIASRAPGPTGRRALDRAAVAAHGVARSARPALCRVAFGARNRTAGGFGALPPNPRRFRRTRSRLRIGAAAHRCVDRSARLYQQAAVAA